MIYLLLVSLIWAFSFGIIKDSLTGIDPYFLAFLRLLISLIVFLPFLNLKIGNRKTIVKLTGVGSIQFGLMYCSYIWSFQYLKAYEVAIFTIFTPVYVTLFDDILNKKINFFYLATSLLAVIGAGVTVFYEFERSDFFLGLLLVQLSNISFAVGQILYKRIMKNYNSVKDKSIYAYLFAGGMLVALVFSLFSTGLHPARITINQWLSILYLGLVGSGIGLFLWNYGARLTNTGTLAIFNNLKIPLAVSVSILVFGETADLFNLFLGGSILLTALIINERYSRKFLH